MAHRNKKMPLDRYPNMDNDLKTNGGGGEFVTHPELESAVNELTTEINEVNNSLSADIRECQADVRQIQNDLSIEEGNLEFTNINSVIDTISGEFFKTGNVYEIQIDCTFNITVTDGQIIHVANIDFAVIGLQKPKTPTCGCGMSAVAQIMPMSSKIEIRPFVNVSDGRHMKFHFVYITGD